MNYLLLKSNQRNTLMMSQLLSLCLILTTSLIMAFDFGKMSNDEKVGQLIMAYFDGDTVNENAFRLLKEVHIGGIIYYNWANGLTSPQQVRALSENLQRAACDLHLLPLFIAIDQEGGRVTHLTNGFTQFPSNAEIAASGDSDKAFNVAYQIGSELRSVGININFAPVVDVNNNPENPVIGNRSFSANPLQVTSFAQRAIQGYASAGILPTLKHFPGHGDVTTDSHFALPIVNKSLAEMEQMELIPFRKLSASCPLIMTAHVLYTKLDPHHPATLSSYILQDLLRKNLGFSGVIISDSLAMKGVTPDRNQVDEIAIQAFEAGCDLLLIGGWSPQERQDHAANIEAVVRVHQKLVKAVESGRISQARLDESLQRILNLKYIRN